jgi:DNA ligase-1
MLFKELAAYFEKIEMTTSRLTITQLLGELFNKVESEEIDKTVYLLQGRISPLYERVDFGVAEKMILRCISKAFNVEPSYVLQEFKKIGDIGKTTELFRGEYASLEEKDLSVLEVYELLTTLASAGGAGSQEIKINILASIIRQLDASSAKYVVRIPPGVMRLGFSDMTILDSFSWMVSKDKSLRPLLQKAYHVRPDLGFIGETLKTKGADGLEKVKPEVFTPIIMMRAERLSSGSEIIEKLGASAVEPKYDGFRLQVHFQHINQKYKIKLFSRSLDDVTFMYPDIVVGLEQEVKVKEAIFEGEAIGFDPHAGTFLPFQETVQRKRKHGIEEKAKEIPLKLFAFELLYADGVSYIDTAFQERRKHLEAAMELTGNIFKDTILLSPEVVIDNEKDMELQFDDAIAKGLEGIMAKKLNGIYQPGARGANWIKFKRSYSSKIEDTIDCLVMGFDFGKGKRVDFGIGAFLVGVYDEKNDKFVTVAKIGTGLSDEEWRELKTRGEKFSSNKMPVLYEVDKMMNVDQWIKPEIVVEIKADEITKSTVHTAGRVLKPSKSGNSFDIDTPGYALRFPRLQRFRDDKRPEEVTTLDEIVEMHRQAKK